MAMNLASITCVRKYGKVDKNHTSIAFYPFKLCNKKGTYETFYLSIVSGLVIFL